MGRHILQVYLFEFSRNLRRRGFLLATFGLPVLLFGLSTLYSVLQIRPMETGGLPINMPAFDFEGIKTAGFVDLSDQFSAVPEKLSGTLIRYDSEEDARAALNAKAIDLFYVIQADYLETGHVIQHTPGFSMNLMGDNAEALIQALVYNTFAPDADANLLRRLQDPLANAQEINLQKNNENATDGADSLILIVFSLLFSTVVFMTNGYLMQSIIEEKESRLIEILVTTMRPIALLTGKILAFGTLGLIQVIIWFCFTLLFSQLSGTAQIFSALQFLTAISIPVHLLPLMLVYFLLGYLLMAAIFGAIGAISNSSREGPQYATVFILLTFVPYWVFSVFAEAPNSTIPVVLSLFPFTSPLSMLMRLLIAPVPAGEVILSLVILVLSVAGTLWLAGRVFHMQTLLSGKLPRLRDLPSIIRG